MGTRLSGQNQNPINLAMTEEFVRKLLARWIGSKIATVNALNPVRQSSP